MGNTYNDSEYTAEKENIISLLSDESVPKACLMKRLKCMLKNSTEHTSDSDIVWIKARIKTDNFSKKMSFGRAKRLMEHIPSCETSFAEQSCSAYNEYLNECEKHTHSVKFVSGIIAIIALLLFAVCGVMLFIADNNGWLYGTRDLRFTAEGYEYIEKNAIKYNQYVKVGIPNKEGYDVLGIINAISGEMLFDKNGISNETVSNRDLSDFDAYQLEVVYEPHVYSATVCTTSGATLTTFEYTVEDEPNDVIASPQCLEGYVFDGWFLDADFKKPFSGDFGDYAYDKEPLILYPHYSLDNWTIIWDPNCGNILSNDLINDYTIFTDVALPKSDVVTREGYNFIGWQLNGNIISYFTPTVMKDITLIAVWEPKQYELNYELCGGEFIEDYDITYTVEDAVKLPEPRRKAYIFEGWFYDKSYYRNISVVEKGNLGNKTFYAKWTPITYYISYDLNGGINSEFNPNEYNADRSVRLYAPQRLGYKFIGWVDDSKSELVTELIAQVNEHVNLIAVWEANQYTITVCPNNGQEPYRQQVRYGEYYAIAPPSYRGHTFNAYMLNGEAFPISNIYTIPSNIQITADYATNTYTINYISEHVKIATQQVVYGESFSFIEPEYRKNYEFVGWFDKEIGGSQISEGIYKYDSNIQVYAVWLKIVNINLESGKKYVIDFTIDKAYIIGNYTGKTGLCTDVRIVVSKRDANLTVHLINAGFTGKADKNAFYCENTSYLLTIINTGTSYIQGGYGTSGVNGVSGSAMTSSNCNGTDGQKGKHAISCGRVAFESTDDKSTLTLKGGNGGNGGNGGVDTDRSRMWLNYLPDGGNGASSGAALYCIAYSINGTTVKFEQGLPGKGGQAGFRADWWTSKCPGTSGSNGKQLNAIVYKH